MRKCVLKVSFCTSICIFNGRPTLFSPEKGNEHRRSLITKSLQRDAVRRASILGASGAMSAGIRFMSFKGYFRLSKRSDFMISDCNFQCPMCEFR